MSQTRNRTQMTLIKTANWRAPARCDLAVVGAGILGLAVARELLRRHPRLDVCVFDKEPRVGAHQTGHNSGVLHRGVYYAPGSLKARLCVEGAVAMERYCESRSIALEHCGKVIVATSPAEAVRLDELERRSRTNGVPGIRRLSAGELREIEPHATGVAALHSPRTAIVDFSAVALALRDDVRAAGGVVVTGCRVEATSVRGRRLEIAHSHGSTDAGSAVFCAGAWSDRLAVAAGGDPDPRIVPFRGAYLKLRDDRRHLVRSLIYPVPDPSLPFLGVHLTRHISGDVLVGPSALLAPSRDAYRLTTLRGVDMRSTLGWAGTHRMARRWWRTGLRELHLATSRAAFVRDAARYVPELRLDDVVTGPAGVRAQAVRRDGSLCDDFVFSHTEHALHVRNAPSPAATSALAIAAHIADQAGARFDLGSTEPSPIKESA